MKYKVGDRVRIKSLDWYKLQCADDNYPIIDGLDSQWCGHVMTIDYVEESWYCMREDNGFNYWTDEMIESLVEEETKPNIIEEAKTYWDSIKDAWICPNGYIFKDENGNVINATKIVLEKKEYPKTLEECCEVLDTGGYQIDYFVKPGEVYEYEKVLVTKISALYNLIICRDAYWKLYGEEMGLDKPWEPDWNTSEPKYVIAYTSRGIEKQWETTYCKGFAFPTEEMRDKFYENFKKEIEICKELL